jgi:hypothetical protein
MAMKDNGLVREESEAGGVRKAGFVARTSMCAGQVQLPKRQEKEGKSYMPPIKRCANV